MRKKNSRVWERIGNRQNQWNSFLDNFEITLAERKTIDKYLIYVRFLQNVICFSSTFLFLSFSFYLSCLLRSRLQNTYLLMLISCYNSISVFIVRILHNFLIISFLFYSHIITWHFSSCFCATSLRTNNNVFYILSKSI